jgi:hypothetical protein
MKQLMIALMLLVGFTTITEAKSHKQTNTYGSFYSHLSPYGVWMEFDDGLVAWRPTIMRRGWAPYSLGRWVWTEYGWYWDSYESFGYITYHYGRWFYDDYYGWIWIPDYDWAPAWVEWRYDDNYIGWAPLPPYAVFSITFGLHFTFDYVTPYNHWHFVNYDYMCDPYVYNYYVGPKYKYRIFSNTKYRNDYGYSNGRIINRGVDITEIRSRSGQDIRQRNLQQVSDPRELTRKERDRNNDVVRTFIPSPEELRNDNIRDLDVRKIERRSTLETSKLRIGDRKDVRDDLEIRKRDDDLRNVIKERENKSYSIEEKRRVTEENRNLNDVKRNNVNDIEKKRTLERMDAERKQEEIRILNERQKKENSTFENQVRRNDVNNSRNEDKEKLKDRNFQIQKEQTEVKVERKFESNRKENRNYNRSEGQKRNDSRGNDQRMNQERNTMERTRIR